MNPPKLYRFLSGLCAVALAVTLASCQNPISDGGSSSGKLSISVADNINSRTLTPAVSMDAASYTVTGTGPDSATFTETTTGAAVVKDGLAFGTWTIVVNALNASGTLIGAGTAVAQINTGDTTTVSVTVTPIAGTGSLSLSVAWPAAQVQTPSIAASLTPALGTAQNLAFTVSGATASYAASALGNGYYTLAFTVNDNSIPVAGAVEVVRIVTGQQTIGAYTFTNVNAPGGSIQVNINADLQNPLDVAIAGASATMTAGNTQTLTASVSNYTGNVSYVWYVNGVSAATGASYVFGSGVSAGYYRVDVVAFAADGSRAGSVAQNIQVTASAGGNLVSPNIGTLIYVPAGSFQRDATVTNISVITQPYRMSQYEITRAQFLAVMGTDPSHTTYSSGTSDPVQQANWYHAIAFCNKMSIAEGLAPVYSVSGVDFATLTYAGIPTASNADWNAATATWTNNGYRLPTEMEWMWAAMGAPADGQGGGTNTTGYAKTFAGSTGSNAIGDYAVFGYYGTETGRTTTQRSNPVGSKLANELGLYDMSGNVWEWSWDWYASYPSGTQMDYRGAASGAYRVVRGGRWVSSAAGCTVAYRGSSDPHIQYFNIGFRVVRP